MPIPLSIRRRRGAENTKQLNRMKIFYEASVPSSLESK
jgi:hypothetical protein